MSPWHWVVASSLWTCGCVALAWRYPRAVRQVGDGAASHVAEALELGRSDQERVAFANETLDDIEHGLVRFRQIPTIATWLMISGDGLLLVGGALWAPGYALVPIIAAELLGLGRELAARRARL